ncbi:uncharacterized protein LOC121383493 [Gigantopelta aegis]|uniref:uncharacterized protein LOC121383493 n=1 Tax=Gigantopelta aegis TaxID=1735272 RepID=UPI001B88CD64|nr:uncharacterized protein LOC121383493 [Gigantopelta aegis]
MLVFSFSQHISFLYLNIFIFLQAGNGLDASNIIEDLIEYHGFSWRMRSLQYRNTENTFAVTGSTLLLFESVDMTLPNDKLKKSQLLSLQAAVILFLDILTALISCRHAQQKCRLSGSEQCSIFYMVELHFHKS